MLKKTSLFITFILLSVIMFNSCQKENIEITKGENFKNDTEERILKFKEKINSGNKSDELISVDSAVWYIEAALNYTYCIVEDETFFEESDFFADSVKVSIVVNDNSVNFSNVSSVYNELFQVIENNINSNTKKAYLIDIEYKDEKISCKYNFAVKNSAKVVIIDWYPDLNYDWHSGAGTCYENMGRCDYTYPDKSAATIWSKYITCSKGVPVNAYYTDIQKGIWYKNPNNNTTPELDTMLFKGYFESVPCIVSDDMNKYFNRGKVIANRYVPPQGWGVPKVEYTTLYTGNPGLHYTILKVYKGKINSYNPPSEL